jgi:hypothetical protein
MAMNSYTRNNPAWFSDGGRSDANCGRFLILDAISSNNIRPWKAACMVYRDMEMAISLTDAWIGDGFTLTQYYDQAMAILARVNGS